MYGLIIWLMDYKFPSHIADFFGIDVLQDPEEFYHKEKVYITGDIVEVREGVKMIHSLSIKNVSGEALTGLELSRAK